MGDEKNGKKTYEKQEELDPPPYATGGQIQGGQSSDNVGSSGNSGATHPATNSSQNWQNNYQLSGPYVNQGFNYGGDIHPSAVTVAVGNMQSGPSYQMLSNLPPPTGPPAMMDDQWRHGLFSCFDNIGICLATCICPEFTYFFIAYYSKRTAFWFGSFFLVMLSIFFWFVRYFATAISGDWGVVVFIILSLLALTTVILRIALLIFFRHRIRKDYNIKGHLAEDALVTCCCRPCSMCQMMSEVDHQMLKIGRRTVFTRS